MLTDHPGNQRILILDDDGALIEIVTEYLGMDGFEVKGIQRPAELFSTIADFDPHLFITDYLLGDINGGELCHQLKTNEQYAHIPVIIYSAYPKVMLSLGTYGCDEFIAKPFDLELLSSKIKQILRVSEPGSLGGHSAMLKII